MDDWIDQAKLKRILRYCPTTGEFTWLISPAKNVKPGMIAGNTGQHGYKRLRYKGMYCLVHRLAFLYMTGDWPIGHVDHINHIRNDNRWENLRDGMNHTTNGRNVSMNKNNKTGVCGLYRCPVHRKWIAQITSNGKRTQLYIGDDFFEACCRRKSEERKRGFHINHGAKR